MNGHRREETQSLLEMIGTNFPSPFTIAEVFAKRGDQLKCWSRKQLGRLLYEQSRLSPDLIPHVSFVRKENGSCVWHVDFSPPNSDTEKFVQLLKRAFDDDLDERWH